LNTLQAEKVRDLIAFLVDNGWQGITVEYFVDTGDKITIAIKADFPEIPRKEPGPQT